MMLRAGSLVMMMLRAGSLVIPAEAGIHCPAVRGSVPAECSTLPEETTR